MTLDGQMGFGVFVYFTILGAGMTSLFVDSRLPLKRTLLLAYALVLPVLAAELLIYRTMGVEALMLFYTPVVHLPYLLFFAWISRHRGWQMVFRFLSLIQFCLLIQHGGVVFCLLCGRQLWALILGYALLTAAVLVFLLLFLRPLSRRVFQQLHGGWWLMCLILAAYYGISIYLIPGFAGISRLATILKPALSLLMVGVYVVFLYLFAGYQREMEARHSAALDSLRLSGFQKRLRAIQSVEESIRVERHDLRHRLQAVAELVAQGKNQEALDFIGAAQKKLEGQKVIRWCCQPVLDAVFSTYFDQAKRQGISVEAEISLPASLPVDEGELALVFANALENAIHACGVLEGRERVVRCRVIAYPSLMFEISNPCAGTVCFDESGLPVSRQEGHGYGARSIAAFCRKYGATYQFEQKSGIFSLQVIL